MIIKNKRALATTDLRRCVLDIIEAGIARVLPPAMVKSAVKNDPIQGGLTLSGYTYNMDSGRIFIIGGGKASGSLAEAIEKIITPQKVAAGIVTCKGSSRRYPTNIVEIIEAGHPLPDQRGVGAVEKMLALKSRYSIDEKDLVICLISGGGSTLLPCPADGISLEEKQIVTGLLLRSGAEIHKINTVRKHLSKTKGGRLGLFFSPASVVSLILSDVVGNDLDVIASGPTVPDLSTFSDAYGVLAEYDLLSATPENILALLRRGCQGEIPETPKTLANCCNFIIGGNRLALEAMAEKAKELGLAPCIVTTEQKGDSNVVAKQRANEILSGKYTGYNIILIGGETTLRVPACAGKGGRNQHYSLVSALALQEYPGEWALASMGTDGSDFLPDVGGAIIDSLSLASAVAKGIDLRSYVDRYDSNAALRKVGHSLVVTGDTGTNVGDAIIYAMR